MGIVVQAIAKPAVAADHALSWMPFVHRTPLFTQPPVLSVLQQHTGMPAGVALSAVLSVVRLSPSSLVWSATTFCGTAMTFGQL